MKKRIFSIFMIFTLCFINVNQAYADAGTLVVGGGSLGVAGLTGASLAGLAVPALAVIGVAMVAAGVNIEISRNSQEAGMTKTEYLKSRVEHYCNEASITSGVFYKMILDGAQVLSNGSIAISNTASNTIKQFLNYLIQEDQIQSPDVSVPSVNGTATVVYNGVTYQLVKINTLGMYYSSSGSFKYVNFSSPVYAYRTGDNSFGINFVSLNEFTATGDLNLSYSGTPNYLDYYFNSSQYEAYRTEWDLGGIAVESLPVIRSSIYNFVRSIESLTIDEGSSDESIDGFTGDVNNITNVINNVFNPTDTEKVVINPNVITDIKDQITDVITDGTIAIDDYIGVLIDSIDGIQDIAIDITNEITGIKEHIIDLDIDYDPTLELENDTDLEDEDKEPIIDDDKEPTGDLSIDPLTMDLKGVFPFCIPYDFKDMLGLLDADPVAPRYTVNWHIPIVEQNLVFTVDLTPFSDVASVMRKMELLAFCIALAVVTRSMFIRG